MTTRQVCFDCPAPGSPAREEWLTWCNRHGLDPMTIPVPQTAYVDDDQRTITLEVVNRALLRAGVERPASRITVQLESKALPFPASGYETRTTR